MAPFGTVTLQPEFNVDGEGRDIDSIAFWEASDPQNSLMFVTAKANQLVEVWKYPFTVEQSPLTHTTFISPTTSPAEFRDNQVNGVAVDQATDRLYVAVGKPPSTVSVFTVPELAFEREFISGTVNLTEEPNLALLNHSNGQTWAYVSAGNIVYIHDANTGAKLRQFTPSEGLETMVADDLNQVLYIPDESGASGSGSTGVFAYQPDGTPYVRNGTNHFGAGVFQSDAEGILLYRCLSPEGRDTGAGFLVVADQIAAASGGTDFEFFHRQTWAHLGTLKLNGVSDTDGIASTQQASPAYPMGLFASHNNNRSVAGIGWDLIMDATGLNCGAPVATRTATPIPTATNTPTMTPTPIPVTRLEEITFEDATLTHPTSGVDVAEDAVLESSEPLKIKGQHSARIPGTNGYLLENFTAAEDLYASFYLRLTTMPTTTHRIALVRNGAVNAGYLRLTSAGILQLYSGSTKLGETTGALSAGTVYRIGLRQRQGTGGDAILEAYLAEGDAPFGEAFAATASGTWTTAASQLRLGVTTSGFLDATFDDIILDTTAMPAPTP